eukprot:5560949-Pyramimonas_sp.AAC.1
MATAEEMPSLWGDSDAMLKDILAEMTRQPVPHLPKPWVLKYVPPKHLRIPGYDYGSVEDTEDTDMRTMVQTNAGFQRKRRSTPPVVAFGKSNAQSQANDQRTAKGLMSPNSYGNLQDLAVGAR